MARKRRTITGSLEVRRLRRIEGTIEGPVTVHRGATLEISGLLNGPTVVEPGGTLEVTGVVKGLIVLGAEASCSLFGEISASITADETATVLISGTILTELPASGEVRVAAGTILSSGRQILADGTGTLQEVEPDAPRVRVSASDDRALHYRSGRFEPPEKRGRGIYFRRSAVEGIGSSDELRCSLVGTSDLVHLARPSGRRADPRADTATHFERSSVVSAQPRREVIPPAGVERRGAGSSTGSHASPSPTGVRTGSKRTSRSSRVDQHRPDGPDQLFDIEGLTAQTDWVRATAAHARREAKRARQDAAAEVERAQALRKMQQTPSTGALPVRNRKLRNQCRPFSVGQRTAVS